MSTFCCGEDMSASTKRGSSARKSNQRKRKPAQVDEFDYSLRSEIIVIAVIAFTAFLFLCNFKLCGAFGNAISSVLFGLFGITAYIAPLVLLMAVVIGIANFGSSAAVRKIVSGVILFIIIGLLAELLQFFAFISKS